ncbi:MAG: hypothetical protein H3C56_10720, partial [Chitinophagaceae bacterium]|nr:hypothetical protein [Chitinophagaceae bacterium]
EKIQSTPNGYEDEEPTECPTAEAGRFWGWGTVKVTPGTEFNPTQPGCPCGGWLGYQEYYIFGIFTLTHRDAVKCAPCTN